MTILVRTPKTAPARRVLTARRSITKAKIRLSTDKKKRIAAMREQIKSSKRTEPNENDIEYSKFEVKQKPLTIFDKCFIMFPIVD